jgi:hypothetical protein
MVGIPEQTGRGAAGPERRKMERVFPRPKRAVPMLENNGKYQYSKKLITRLIFLIKFWINGKKNILKKFNVTIH